MNSLRKRIPVAEPALPLVRWTVSVHRYLGAGTVSAMGLSALATASKAFGLARELLMAWAFGTSAVVDGFRIGLTYTTFASHVFFGEATTGTVVPTLGARKRGDAEDDAAIQVRAGLMLGALCTMIPLGLVFFLVPGTVLGVLTPRLDPDQYAHASSFLRVFGLGLPLYGFTAVAVMVRQAADTYWPLGLRPAGQNVFLIVGIIAAAATSEPLIIAVTFVAYYAVLSAVLSPRELLGSLAVGARTALRTLRALAARWLPLAVGLMLVRSNVLVERYFAGRLPTGAISALDYARTLTDLPLLLVAVPAGAVLLTRYSRTSAQTASRRVARKLGAIMLGAVTWSVCVIWFARPLTSLLFARGAFDAASVDATSRAVVGLGVGAWAVVLSHLLLQYLMATRSTRVILAVGGGSVLACVVLALLLVPPLGLLGLALASAASPITVGVFGVASVAWRIRRARRRVATT